MTEIIISSGEQKISHKRVMLRDLWKQGFQIEPTGVMGQARLRPLTPDEKSALAAKTARRKETKRRRKQKHQ